MPSASLADAVTVIVAGAVNVDPFTGDVTLTVGAISPPASRAARYAFNRPPDATTPDHAASGSTLFMSNVLIPAGVRPGFKSAHQRSDAGDMRCRHARAALCHVARDAGAQDGNAGSRDVHRRRAVVAKAGPIVDRNRMPQQRRCRRNRCWQDRTAPCRCLCRSCQRRRRSGCPLPQLRRSHFPSKTERCRLRVLPQLLLLTRMLMPLFFSAVM